MHISLQHRPPTEGLTSGDSNNGMGQRKASVIRLPSASRAQRYEYSRRGPRADGTTLVDVVVDRLRG